AFGFSDLLVSSSCRRSGRLLSASVPCSANCHDFASPRQAIEGNPMTDKDLETTRRGVLGGVAALGATVVSGAVQEAQAQTAQRTFVLVHGTWHGGWCWRR